MRFIGKSALIGSEYVKALPVVPVKAVQQKLTGFIRFPYEGNE